MSLRSRKATDPKVPSESIGIEKDHDVAAAEKPAAVAATSPDASAKKEPPPEKPEDMRQRSYVILSFWLIVVLLGLPIWWATTTIYRANLPLDQMMEWADGKVRRGTKTWS